MLVPDKGLSPLVDPEPFFGSRICQKAPRLSPCSLHYRLPWGLQAVNFKLMIPWQGMG
jgi:hypothetical protein